MPEPPINSLDRFRKRSGRLVLEEHAHCEVPAGCGGVVLRWRNPLTAVPLVVSLYTPGKGRLFLDGAEVELNNVDLAPGPHLLVVTLDEVDLAGGLFQFAAVHQTDRYRTVGTPVLAESNWRLISATDRTWLATTDQPPGDGWSDAMFDDGSWAPLTRAVARPPLGYNAPGAFQSHRCNEARAALLALPAGVSGRGRAWVCRRFTVPAPRTS